MFKYLPEDAKIPENPLLDKTDCFCRLFNEAHKQGQQSILSLLVDIGDIDEKIEQWLLHQDRESWYYPSKAKPFSEWLKGQKK